MAQTQSSIPTMRIVNKDQRDHLEIKSGGYYFTARQLTENDAHAIHRACNTHDRLINVIQNIIDNDAEIAAGRDKNDPNFERPVLQDVQKLLAEARGEV